MPAALGALCLIVWDARNRLEAKHAEQSKTISEQQAAMSKKVDDIHDMMRTELRTLDVRLSIVEQQLNINAQRR